MKAHLITFFITVVILNASYIVLKLFIIYPDYAIEICLVLVSSGMLYMALLTIMKEKYK